MKIIQAFLAVFAFTTFSMAGTYEYKLTGYPKSDKGCHGQAKESAEKLAAAVGARAKILSGRCMEEGKLAYTISIRYESDKELDVVSTDDGRLVLSREGVLKTREECDAAISTETQEFEKETGLSAVFSYCKILDRAEKRPYFIRIDGIGTAKRAPYHSEMTVFALPIELPQGEAKRLIQEGFRARGYNLRFLAEESQIGMSVVAAYYYGDKRLYLQTHEPTRHNKKEECLTQLEDARAAFSQLSNPPFAVYCAKNSLGGLELNLVAESQLTFAYSPSAEKFKTFADCMADRNRLVGYYQTEVKIPAFLGLCTADRNGYSVQLFEHRN